MYRVALCEDEIELSQVQEKICRDILDKLNVEYSISVFESSDDFLKAFLTNTKQYDLILLDIIMDGLNGMELACEIRKHDSSVTIIFITSTRDYALQGYDVNAYHYLLKPLDSTLLEALIRSDYHNRFLQKYLIFKSEAQTIKVPVKDIICAETEGRRVAITLPDKTVYYPGKLSELLAKLPGNQFVQCHKAFMVNIFNTVELTRKFVIATNGIQIPISRTYTKNVKKAFLKSIRET